MGKNIRAGTHYTQVIAYDFDSDGRTEIVMKTTPGTIDRDNYITDADVTDIIKTLEIDVIVLLRASHILKGKIRVS